MPWRDMRGSDNLEDREGADAIGPGRQRLLAIGFPFVVETPTTDHDRELRTLRTQALEEAVRSAIRHLRLM